MKILLLNQCFYPDVVSTSQHLTDLAVGLVDRGYQVTVLTSRRGYDDPAQHYRSREKWRGIDIIRIPTLGLGKVSKWLRCLDFATYLMICFARLMFLPRQDLTVALTSPPLISFFGALFAQLRGGHFCFWVMDLNPDEGVELGWVREKSLFAKALQALLKYSLEQSDQVIALDRFMRERIVRKGIPAERVLVVPPWSHDNDVVYDEVGRKAFRALHGLNEKFVVMYSGNHSACHPLDTLLSAARVLRDDKNIVFCFVGGGSDFPKVKEFARTHSLSNILCLPYQPRNSLSGSLSAADLHVVVMGDRFKGLVHPCKVYNILAIGAPFLYIGPQESHITDLWNETPQEIGAFSARHGEVVKVVTHIQAAVLDGSIRISSDKHLLKHFSSHALLAKLIICLEQVMDSPARFSEEPLTTKDDRSL